MANATDRSANWKRSCPAQNGVSITNEAECRSACSNLEVKSYEAKEYSDCPRCWFENSDCRWNTNSKAKEECRDTRQEVCIQEPKSFRDILKDGQTTATRIAH